MKGKWEWSESGRMLADGGSWIVRWRSRKRDCGCWRVRGRFLCSQGKTVPCHPRHSKSIMLLFGRCTCWEKSGGILPVGGNIIDITAFALPQFSQSLKIEQECLWTWEEESEILYMAETCGIPVQLVKINIWPSGYCSHQIARRSWAWVFVHGVVCLGFLSSVGGCIWNSGSFCHLD